MEMRSYKCLVQGSDRTWLYEYEARNKVEAELFVKEDMQAGDKILEIWSPKTIRTPYTKR